MRWASDGQIVYVRLNGGGMARAKVLCAAGDLARVAIFGDDPERMPTMWQRVDHLISEETVAADAAERLGAP